MWEMHSIVKMNETSMQSNTMKRQGERPDDVGVLDSGYSVIPMHLYFSCGLFIMVKYT